MILLSLIILVGLFWLAIHLTGALLGALFWLFIKVPLFLILFVVAIGCMCTLILIPVGLSILSFAWNLLFP